MQPGPAIDPVAPIAPPIESTPSIWSRFTSSSFAKKVSSACSFGVNYVLKPPLKYVVKPALTHVVKPLAVGTYNNVIAPGASAIADTEAAKKVASTLAPVVNKAALMAQSVASIPQVAYCGRAIKNNTISMMAKAADLASSYIAPLQNEHIEEQQKKLKSLPGGSFIEKSIRHGTPNIVRGISNIIHNVLIERKKNELRKLKEEEFLKQNIQRPVEDKDLPKIEDKDLLFNIKNSRTIQGALPNIVEGLLYTIFVNILNVIPTRTNNPLHDIIAHLIGIANKHIRSQINRLRDIERLPEKERNKQLIEFFAPLHKEILDLVLPLKNGSRIESLGLGDVAYTLLGFVDLENPAGFVTLYRKLIDPLCEPEDRTKILNQTQGGKVLLQIVQLASEKLPELLLNLLGDTSPLIADLLLPIPPTNPNPSAEEKVSIGEQLESRRQLIKSIHEVATSKAPAPGTVGTAHEQCMGAIQEFGHGVVHSVLTKVFLNLATNNGQQPLGPQDDPMPLVVKKLIEVLKQFYKDQGSSFKAQFNKLYLEYREYIAKSRRWKILEKQGINPDPRVENVRLSEMRTLKTWLSNWQKNDDRKNLVKTVFTPVGTKILEVTGMNKVEGLRFDLGDLNQIIQESMPEGFCALFELTIVEFPDFMGWIDPEVAVKEKSAQLNKITGNPAFSALAKAFAPVITSTLPDIFDEKSSSWAADMLKEINDTLPDNLKLTLSTFQANYAHLHAGTTAAFKNVGARNPATDELWKFACMHVEETLLDLFLANTNKSGENPIVEVATRCLNAFTTFQKNHGARLATAYANLPKNPSEKDLEALYKQFANYQGNGKNLFEMDLFNPLTDITALNKVLNDGKLAVFYLDSKIKPNLSYELFKLHCHFVRHNPHPEEILDQLSAAFYDKERLKNKMGNNSDLTALNSQSIDPNGKNLQQRQEIWNASGASDHAKIVQQISDFITDIIGNTLRPLLAQNSDVISAHLNTELSLQGTPTKDLIKVCIESLAGSNSDVFKAIWPLAQGFLNTAITQVIANTLETTQASMPRAQNEHRQWSFLGDLSARICQVMAEVMPIIAKRKAEIATLKSEIAKVKGVLGQEAQYRDLNKKIHEIYRTFADPLLAIIKGNNLSQDPLQSLPLSDVMKTKLWEVVIPAKLGDVLIDLYDTTTPEIHLMQDELYTIYNSNHVSEMCRYIARCVRDGTPFALGTKYNEIGPKLFSNLEKFLKTFQTGPGKDLSDSLAAQKGSIEQMFSHTMHQIGANMDHNGVMKESVWPFLEKYAHPLILSLAVKFSRQMDSFGSNDPDYMLKFSTGLLTLVAKHFKKMNEVTKQLRESAPYKVSQEDMFKGFGDSLHPALKEGRKTLQKDEIQDIRVKHVYMPFLKDLLEFIGYSAEDIPAPAFLKGPLFSLFSESLGPLSLGLMVNMMFNEDGKEAAMDKMESKILDNMQSAMDAFSDYAIAAQSDQILVKPTDAQRQLSEKLLKECADVVHELVQTTPDWLSQQLLSLNTIKKMTAGQLAEVIKQMCHDWPLIKIIDRSAEVGLPNMSEGVWKGVGKRKKFVPNSQDINFDETPVQKQHRLAQEEIRARDNKCRTARIAADGLFIGAKIPFQKLWAKIEQGIIWLCNKLFGKKFGPPIHRAILTACAYIGKLLSWIFAPLYYLGWQILYGIMKIQAGFAHKNLKHPAHINLLFEMFRFMGQSAKEEALSIKTKLSSQKFSAPIVAV